MSHIPNSAMPHATAEPQQNQDKQETGSSMSRGYDAVKEKARQYPKTAIAAGAAVVAGAVAAAAIPLVRGRGETGTESKKKTSGSKAAADKSDSSKS